MKTIYSLKEFRDEVGKIAAMANQQFFHVDVRLDHDDSIVFQSYIHTYNFHKAETMEKCLELLRNEVFPPIQKNCDIEVEIEMPVSELQTQNAE